ncbi:uncharacterized protein LOC117371095 [Periophthalmus magnuspinnatus]|uniref:uncharacterized protein LOC117371095 n=1 Tax=Periophthalmus magnuspinnatus TaxID=409849 RepID=UPI00145A590E|nr:uncharacterized protein LOC117371095 [Periophthalmus magnuspinnatus]
MKKSPLSFLGRKNQSLFDTNVKMKDTGNMDLVLGSGTIIESGTASVKARPTVKHYSSSDSFQAFAVPTPTVPHYAPAINGTKINGSVSDDQSSNGSTISVTDPIEGEIFVPAPPSMAPPPPPTEVFVLPPPEFMGDLSTLQCPPMPGSKAPSQFVSLQEDNFTFLAPPPMSPPKPPSTGSNSSPVPILSSVETTIPEHPKYAPPQPPAEKPKSYKNPPPKPIRISSVQNLDTPPDTPAPPPPVHTPTPSTFNPQSPAKLYNSPKSSFVNSYEDPSPKIKPKLFFEDARSGPVVQNDTKLQTQSMDVQKDIKSALPKPVQIETTPKTSFQMTPPQTTPPKMAPPKIPPLQMTPPQTTPPKMAPPKIPPLQMTSPQSTPPKITPPQITLPKIIQPKNSPPQITPCTSPQSNPDRKPLTAASLKELNKTPKITPVQKITSLKPEKLDKPDGSPTLNGKYSPIIDNKLRNISAPSTTKDTSPLALLMAAKQRDKHKPITHETSVANRNSLLSTNSGSTLSLNSVELQPESPKPEPLYAMPNKQPKEVNTALSSASLLLNKTVEPVPGSSSLTTPNLPKVDESKPDLDVPFLPPPPEFDDLDEIEPPPTMRPPDLPKMSAPSFTPVPPPPPPKLPAQTTIATPIIPTPPKPAPAPPLAPQLPPHILDTTVKSKPPPVLAKPKPAQAPLPTASTPNQTTLLNILKKKMMEMDQKIGPDSSEQESNSDDWGSPEDNEVPVMPKVNLPKNTADSRFASLDMGELQTKMTQKNQEPNKIPVSTSKGPSRQQYGMTFTVRPGNKEPITLVSKGE